MMIKEKFSRKSKSKINDEIMLGPEVNSLVTKDF